MTIQPLLLCFAMISPTARAATLPTPRDKVVRLLSAWRPAAPALKARHMDQSLLIFNDIFDLEYLGGMPNDPVRLMTQALEHVDRPDWALEPLRVAVMSDPAAHELFTRFMNAHRDEVGTAYRLANQYFLRLNHVDRARDRSSNGLGEFCGRALIMGATTATAAGAGLALTHTFTGLAIGAATPIATYAAYLRGRYLVTAPRPARLRRDAVPVFEKLDQALTAFARQ